MSIIKKKSGLLMYQKKSAEYMENKSHALSGLEISASGSVRIYPE